MASYWKGRRGHLFAIILVVLSVATLIFYQPGILAQSTADSRRSSPRTIVLTPPSGQFFDHVVVIVMENQGVYDICKTSPPPCSTGGPAPYLSNLANNYTIGSQYLSLIETSQPNYVALISGSMQGCTSSGCPVIKAPNLVDRFEAAGLSWKGYMENQTLAAGCDLNDHQPYVTIHNPFLPFQDITNNTARCNKIVLANPNICGSITDCALINDLNNTSTTPNFMWLTPNDCDNMRGAPGICASLITTGNNYLSRLVPEILNSKTFTTSRSAIFITFDEGNGFCPLNGSSEDCVYAVWAGPQAKTGFGTANLYSHYSFPKTIERNWNLANFTSNDGNANSMSEFFKSTGPDYTITASPALVTLPIALKSNSTITLRGFNNYAGTITITAFSSPAGPTVTLSSSTITLTINGTGSSTLSFTSNTVGSYTVTVTGTSGTLAHNTTLVYHVTPPPNFTVASPSNLVLGQGSFSSAPSTVTTTDDHTSFTYSYQRNAFYAKNLIWFFYQDPRNTCEHESGCLEYTTSTNGTRWATPTIVPVHVADGDYSVYTDNSNIYYVRYNETSFESSCGQKIQFRTGTLNTNGTVTWQPEQTVVTSASYQAYPGEQIVVDSNGQAWVAYFIENKSSCGGSGTDRPQIVHSTGTNNAAWTGNTTLCTASCHSNIWHIALASLGSGQVYASYWLTNRDLHGRLYNGTWQAEEQISPTTTRTDANAWLFNNGPLVYQIYYDNGTETFSLANRSMSGAWTINLIGTGESNTGTIAFSASYNALPDAAGYDATNNQFYVFWMNATNHAIDQWTGTGNIWTKSTGVVTTGTVTYPDSITCFIQTPPTSYGAIFYTSSASSPFTINTVTTSFTSGTSSGTLVVTVTGQNGFTGTVNLTETASPPTGLTISCTPTTIPTGTGTSKCSLTSSTPGSYNVTVTGTSGTLNHSTLTMVTVPMPKGDFVITASNPATARVGQPTNSTIAIASVNGFSGQVSLTDNVPTGLACTSITPTMITGSGSASLSCSAALFGNYTVLLAGASGALSHNATITFRVFDYNLTTASIITSPIGTNTTTMIIVSGLNRYSGNVSLTVSVQQSIQGIPGIAGGAGEPRSLRLAPPSLQPVLTLSPTFLVLAPSSSGQSTLTISLSSSVPAGNYTITVRSTDGTITHTAQLTLQAGDFGISRPTGTLTIPPGSNSNQTITLWGINHFSGNISLGASSSPTGPSFGFNPSLVTLNSNNSTSLLTIQVPMGTPPGNYTITIQATSGAVIHAVYITIRVQVGPTSLLTRIAGANLSMVSGTLSIVGIVTLLSVLIQTRMREKPTVRRMKPVARKRGLTHRMMNQSYITVPAASYPIFVLAQERR